MKTELKIAVTVNKKRLEQMILHPVIQDKIKEMKAAKGYKSSYADTVVYTTPKEFPPAFFMIDKTETNCILVDGYGAIHNVPLEDVRVLSPKELRHPHVQKQLQKIK